MLASIRHRAAEPLTLRRLSGDLARQPEYLGWLFQHETGRTFHERLTVVRLRRAARLIRAGDKIEAVSLQVGYRTKRNFYDQFRRRFGTTPGDYRVRAARSPGSPPLAAPRSGHD